MTDAPRGRHLHALLVLFVVFVIGMASGAAVFFLGQHSAHFGRRPGSAMQRIHDGPPGHLPPPEVLDHLATLLELDDAQRRQAHEIIEASHAEARHLLGETHEKLHEILTSEQRERLLEMHPDGRPAFRGPGAGRGPHRRRHSLPRPDSTAEPNEQQRDDD